MIIKRVSSGKLDEAVDKEFEYVIKQIMHKDDIQSKFKVINGSVSKGNLEMFPNEETFVVSKADLRLYNKINGKIYYISLNEL